MTKKMDMTKATVKVWHRKNRSRIRITQPDGNQGDRFSDNDRNTLLGTGEHT